MAVTARKVVLQIHLYLGLLGAIFLVILGATGSVMAFEGDIDHWLASPSLVRNGARQSITGKRAHR